MKQMQCNALNIQTDAKQVWLYFIGRTTWPGYAGTTTNLQIVFNTQKSSHTKNTCQIFLPQKIPESKIPNPKISFNHPRHLKSGVTPTPRGGGGGGGGGFSQSTDKQLMTNSYNLCLNLCMSSLVVHANISFQIQTI